MERKGTERRRISHADLAGLVGDVVAQGGAMRFEAAGVSMWPFVRSGDGLVVRPLGDDPIAVGEVLLYRTERGGLTAHRVTGRRGAWLQMRGDRRKAPPERVHRGQLLGRVVAIERAGRLRRLSGLRLLPALAWLAVRPWVRHRRFPVRAQPERQPKGCQPLI